MRDDKAEMALKEQEKVWKSTNEDLITRVELLCKANTEKEDEHADEMAEVISEVRGSVVMAICEARIKLEEGVANAGSWNVVGWHEALTKLTGEHVYIGHGHSNRLQVEGEDEEAQKVPVVDDQFVV